MRISTSQIFESGALGIQNNQQGLYRLQNQLSTGRRVLTPSDDPVASAQALIVTQSLEVEGQHETNQTNARSQLGLVEGNLSSLSDLLQNVHERVVSATNPVYSDLERDFIASELRSRLDAMISLANSTDSAGQFLFSGYQGGTRPFAINGSAAPVPPSTVPPVAYYGDEGERLLQVGASRQMPVNVSGAELFMNIRSGNGTFTTGLVASGINQGTATIDAGSVLNPTAWNAGVTANTSYEIAFTSATTYEVRNAASTVLSSGTYVSGQAISLPGGQVVVNGQPATGDRFSIAPSTNLSVFQTMQNLISAIDTPVNASFTQTDLDNLLNAQLTNLDRAMDNLGRVMADVGTRQQELDALGSNSSDMKLQYNTTLSSLQDLDYVAAISNFTAQQTQLQAAQKSFAQISQLSLFNII